MDITEQELNDVVKENWGITVDYEYRQEIIKRLNDGDKLACVIDSIGEHEGADKGFAFCLSDRLVMLGKKRTMTIPINSIQQISYSKGVAYTLNSSVLQLQCGEEKICIDSCRHDLMDKFVQVLHNKTGVRSNIVSEQNQQNAGGAVLGMIVKGGLLLGVLYILSVICGNL